jgi:hypothetical protein
VIRLSAIYRNGTWRNDDREDERQPVSDRSTVLKSGWAEREWLRAGQYKQGFSVKIKEVLQ